jgi:hypothetical protein
LFALARWLLARLARWFLARLYTWFLARLARRLVTNGPLIKEDITAKYVLETMEYILQLSMG